MTKSIVLTELSDLARYRDAWAQPGALTAMIDWYRAAVRSGGRLPGNARIAAPTLIIWGRRDPFLAPALARLSLEYCDRARLVTIDEATHWVQHEEAARVNALLLEHLAGSES